MTSILLKTSLLSFLLPFLLMWVVRPMLHYNIFAEYYCNILSVYYSLIFPLCLLGSAKPIPPYSSFPQISFYNIVHFSGYILTFYCLKTSQSFFQMVYSFIRILTYSPTCHISIINCWKKAKLTISTINTYKTNFRSIVSSF